MKNYASEAERFGSIVLGYQMCEDCRIVDRDRNRCRFGYICSTCGKPSSGGKSFYGFTVISIVDLIIEPYYSIIDDDSTPIPDKMRSRYLGSLVFFCTLKEVLMDSLIESILIAKKVPESISNRILRDNSALNKKFNALFPAVTGSKWDEALKIVKDKFNHDYSDLDELLKKTQIQRDEVLHEGAPWIVHRALIDKCVNSIERVLDLFVDLHNAYVHSYHNCI